MFHVVSGRRTLHRLPYDTVSRLRKHNMQDGRSTVQKIRDFFQAFSEFLGRPKTVFDMKDRFRLLALMVAVIAALEAIIYYVRNC